MWNIRTALNLAFLDLNIEGEWHLFCKTIERAKHVMICSPILWTRPSRGWVKRNTDGSYVEQDRGAETGAVLRDENRDFIMVFSYFADNEEQ